MTKTRINTAAYKAFCEDFRSSFERDVENGLCDWSEYREYLRCEKPAEHLLLSDEYPAAQAAVPASFDEIYGNLRIAAHARQQFGASDAQCREIARRWASEGASLDACRMNTLTAGEARAILG